MLCITNNSIKHQSFFYRQLNHQTVLFQTIQFSMSFVCAQFKCQTVLFYPLIGPSQVLLLWTRVDLGVMAMKGYSKFTKAWASPSDCFVSYPGHSLGESYSICWVQPVCFQSPPHSRLDQLKYEWLFLTFTDNPFIYLLTPPDQPDVTQGQFLSWV